jgi:hypothetical protein
MKWTWTEIWLAIITWIGVNFKWITPIIVGMSAKIAIDSRSKRLTLREIIIKIVIGFFSGFVVSWYLITHGMEHTAMWASPLATMSGESIILFLTINSTKYYKFFSKKWLGMKDKDLDENAKND